MLIVLGIISLVLWQIRVSAQEVRVGDNIDAETFSKAPEASLEIVKAIQKDLIRERSIVIIPDPEEARKLFHALPVTLGREGERDFIVIGSFPYSGGDNDWFWVVRILPGGPKVVLWLGCLNFGFGKTRTNGLLNISNEWNSPNEEIDEKFRFNGQHYVRIAHRDKPMVWKH